MGRKQDRTSSIVTNTQKEVIASIIISYLINSCIIVILACIFLAQEKQIHPLLTLSFSSEKQEEVELVEDVFVSTDDEQVSSTDYSEPEPETVSQLDEPELKPEPIKVKPPTIKKLVQKPRGITPIKNGASSLGSSNIPKGFSAKSIEKMESRLAFEGAKTGDIQISISWDNVNDVDLIVEYRGANGSELIGWNNKIGQSGGWLDVDKNVYPETDQAVENIFWGYNQAPRGVYKIYVNCYRRWDKKKDSTPVLIRIIHNNEVTYRKATVRYGEGYKTILSFKH